MNQAEIVRAIFEALEHGVEDRPDLKVTALGDLGLAICNPPQSITVSARISSDGQRIILEYQRPDETTGVLMKKPDAIEITLAEDETLRFVHKGAQLGFKGVAQLLIKAAESTGGL